MKIIFFVGTTAELIKIAPVMRELNRRKVPFKIVSSNQNELRFKELNHIIGKSKADYTFSMKPYPWLHDIYLRFVYWTVKSMSNYFIYFRAVFKNNRKDVRFIIHGDTVTAVIGAIVAKLCRVKILHVESGLRSFSFLEPFPEELNRFVISWLSDVHFCPNKWAMSNLKYRGGEKINTYGNTVAESLELALKVKRKVKIVGKHKYFILVLHRQEHTLFGKQNTMKIIEQMIGYAKENMKCIFIMHKLTVDYLKKEKIYSKVKKIDNIILPDRLNHSEFVSILNRCEFIATDGGTNQEEAYYLGKPCLILRNRTERIEGLGENAVLSKNNPETIDGFLRNYKKYMRKRPKIKKIPSNIIVDYITSLQI